MRNVAIVSALLTVALVGAASPSGVASKRNTTKRKKVSTRPVATTRVAPVTNGSGGVEATTVAQKDPKQAVLAAYSKYVETFIRVMANPTSAATEYPSVTTGEALAANQKYAAGLLKDGIYVEINRPQYEIISTQVIDISSAIAELRVCERITSTVRKRTDKSIVPDPLNPYVTDRRYQFVAAKSSLTGWLLSSAGFYEKAEGQSECASGK